MDDYNLAYDRLNKEQKEAVDTIDGPVMVVAGPGTGKTQILALRIANILKKTDIGASGILCLTFTNSGVRAMRERLYKYIGQAANEVKVSTFHSFAQKIVEKNYEILDIENLPELLDEQSSVILFDEILHSHDWQYLRPRNNPAQYFYDLKSLISLLKRENVTPEDFSLLIDEQIDSIKNDPDSISTRGESKGKLKKEVEKKIESLERTKESVVFYSIYEKKKKEEFLMDYDDVLSMAVSIIKKAEDIKSSIQEENQYILVDEHQDSSGIQNELLSVIWKDIEKPNIFVVGDDRQLIYGFGGASISYFENFKHTFGKAHLISLVENYRSTQNILDTADNLLKSFIVNGSLRSNNKKDSHSIELYECQYERDEILLAGKLFKKHIEKGLDPNECALLVPKNKQVRSAITILRDMGLPISTLKNISFFDTEETYAFKNVLKVISDPYDSVALGELLFSRFSEIPPLKAHKFMRSINSRNLSLEDMINYSEDSKEDLFSDNNPIRIFGNSIKDFIDIYSTSNIYTLVQVVGKKYFLDSAKNHNDLILRTEVVRTYLHLVVSQMEKNQNIKLNDFLDHINRLESYNNHIPLAVISGNDGISVMTLHGSKGLEFEVVHIAHMNEETLMSGRRRAFILPDKIEERVEEKDELTAKRELYVAITRAKKFCNISYSSESLSGQTLHLVNIIANIDDKYINKNDISISTKIITENGPGVYVENNFVSENVGTKELVEIISHEYTQKNVSVTLLNNFFECPWKWYFSSFLQLPTPKTESLILGSVVHFVIENILKNKAKITEKSLDAIVLTSLNKELIYEEKLRTRVEKNTKIIINNWLKNYYPKIKKDYITERSVSYSDKNFPHLKMYGKIDLTEKDEKGIIVTDFKTGSSKTKSAIEKKDEEGRLSSLYRQLAMYSYLLTGQDVIESKLLFLEENPEDKNSVYATHVGINEIDLLISDIREYDESLKNGSWVTRECKHKSYGNDTKCEYCHMAKSLYK